MARSINVKLSRPADSYTIHIGSGIPIDFVNAIPGLKKAALISDVRVHELYGDAITSAMVSAGVEVITILIPRGESAKSFRTLKKILDRLAAAGINRDDVVIALGGGVVGDVAGLAASLHLRGTRCFHLPTTLLSMVDSSVGGKTGINTDFGKNLIGTFHQPAGVIADITKLASLQRREILAGFMEMVKHGALAGPKLLMSTAELGDHFKKLGPAMFRISELTEKIENIIAEHVKFKLKVVSRDERENILNTGKNSRKVLNLGHTFGHALEKAANYRSIKHGEAVGWGLLYAAEISKKLELLDTDALNFLYDVVRRFDPLPNINHISFAEILVALGHDKKIVSNGLQWILLEGIGKPVIVSGQDIPQKLLIDAHKAILRN